MLHCDLRARWKIASDLRFQAAISEPKTRSFCGNSGDLAASTRKSLAIAIVRFWRAKLGGEDSHVRGAVPGRNSPQAVLMFGIVSDSMRFLVWSCLPKCDAHFIGLCRVGVRIERTG